MAEQLQEVRTRLRSVQNTLQITKAMKMASESKLKKAQQIAAAFSFYVRKSEELLHHLVQSASLNNVYIQPITSDTRPLWIVIGSNKGLCGAYNSNVFEAVHGSVQSKQQPVFLSIGRKTLDHFKRYAFPVISNYQRLGIDDATTATLHTLVNELMQQFKEKKYTSVHLAYNHFVKPMVQETILRPLLPFTADPKSSPQHKKSLPPMHYESGLDESLSYLLPHTLRAVIYGALLDAQAAEHEARVRAMDQASENAKKMLAELKISYNRARQAIITNEIIEILGGAAS